MTELIFDLDSSSDISGQTDFISGSPNLHNTAVSEATISYDAGFELQSSLARFIQLDESSRPTDLDVMTNTTVENLHVTVTWIGMVVVL